MALVKGTLLRQGRYQIQRLLARGGFGFVYLAMDRRSNRLVVLKELLPLIATDPEVQRRFVREGRTMQRLQHPNIARVEAMFKDQDNHYMVVEYLSGGCLSDRLERERKLSLSQATMIAVSLCDALAYLHERGITHCDLNPSNVLFDAQGRPKLVDLGIAHVSDAFVHRSWRTERDFSMGTMLYMAPEQLDGTRDDPRVDLYALATMLYQTVSGRLYLDFDTSHTPVAQADNIQRVRTDTPTPIPELGSAANEVLLRALAKSPQERYANVRAFRRALTQALIPQLPSEQSIRLVAPFQAPAAADPLVETRDWPRWIWIALCAINVTAMLLVAGLLIGVT